MTIRPIGFLAFGALTAWLTQLGVAQPPPVQPSKKLLPEPPSQQPFTAFPDLRGPLTPAMRPRDPDGKLEVVKDRDGKPYMVLDYEKLFAQVVGQFPRPIPKDAPALTKVRIAQVNEGMAYILKFKTQIDIGQFTASGYLEYLKMVCVTFQAAALADSDPAKKRAAYEAQVILMREMENFTKMRVDAGAEGSQQLNQTRFYRLQAEAELLQFLDKK
ncbi:MAG TPA: hypothetical protein VMZ71_14180 [Gemmataceae bacterium]|nr:hypothetical protein [Gemmataceae bacterium]